ncbi:uncharacterized protein LOC125652315 isoform X3 [Ostrea edulis]|uniref:uncharacterized protein LOC125652315 isoform X3 n=1 Tax=Ostrea edulis TaxID=37623 RepID=UPI00209413AF|nr:uncharacterized protein LOC125652315 isoform X3 [Ostrea edulis]
MDTLSMDPAFRHLVKLKDMASKENVSSTIQAEIDKIIDLFQIRARYCDQMTSAASNDLQLVMDSTYSHPWQMAYDEGKLSYRPTTIMLSGNLEVQFLKSLVSMGDIKRVLELGLFTGCSALALAEALPDDGRVVSCEIDPYIAELARSLLDKSPVGNKVDIMLGPAKDALEKLSDQKMEFDLIFLDADKSNYSTYYKVLLPIRDGVMLVRRKEDMVGRK